MGFHYDAELAIKALKRINQKFPRHRFTYSLGDDPLDWHFELGDLVVDTIGVRDIFAAPEGADVRGAIDPMLMRMHTMAAAFSDFAGYFIRKKLER